MPTVQGYKKLNTTIKTIIRLSQKYDVNVSFLNFENQGGAYHYQTDTIEISHDYEKRRTACLGIFFHELGHSHCHKNRLWKDYHIRKPIYGKKKIDHFMSISFRVENWVDRWAEKEMRKNFKSLKFCPSYRTKEHKEWLHNYYTEFFKWRKEAYGK